MARLAVVGSKIIENPQSVRDRIQYLLEHFWGNDRRRMSDACGISNQTLKTVLSKDPTLLQIQQVVAGIRRHASISTTWLETGEGHWRRNGSSSVVATPPPTPSPGPTLS